jgi:GntR family transcriptional regulator of arabinose operon
MPDVTRSPMPSQFNKRSATGQVIRALEEYCATLSPGDQLPSRMELVRQFNASERSVLRALDELERAGKITRRQGARAVVADRQQPNGTKPLLTSTGVESSTIVAIGPHDYSIFDRYMTLLVRQAESADLRVVCRMLDAQTSLPSIAQLKAIEPQGFILFRRDLAPVAKELQGTGSRVVLVGVPPIDSIAEVPWVYADGDQGGYLVTRHLLDLGHRRIVFHDSAFGNYQQTRRWRGYQQAIQEEQRRGKVVHSTVLPHDDVVIWAKRPELAAEYFRRPDAPTGVLAWNDHEAVMLLGILSRAGIKVPDEVSLVGYDNLPESGLVHPSLTTVEHAIEQQLQMALRLLTRPEPPPPSHMVVVMPTLIARESSARAPEMLEESTR